MLRITTTLQKILSKIFGLFCKLVYLCINKGKQRAVYPIAL